MLPTIRCAGYIPMVTAEQIIDRDHAHEQADLHEIIRLLEAAEEREQIMAQQLATVAALVEEFRPMIEAYRQTAGGTVGVFRARKAMRNGG